MPQVVNYRVVNNKDPVPRVPLFHFRHAGILLQLRSSATPGVAGEAQVYPSGGVAPLRRLRTELLRPAGPRPPRLATLAEGGGCGASITPYAGMLAQA